MVAAGIDWSGRWQGAERAIWLAVVRDGRLERLEAGRSRAEVVEEVVRLRPDVAGFDFSFSFPRWFCDARGWRSARDVWAAMSRDGEALLAQEAPPFWGRRAGRPHELLRGLRRTESAAKAKSTFQIGGAGAPGTGSVRGMPHLLRLAEAGFAVWPFDVPRPPVVVEVYPRAFAREVVRSRPGARRAHLAATLRGELLERAAASEDAFDAAVAALALGRGFDRAALPAPDAIDRIEGRIWGA